ncbi:MAG: 16S rRNA (cytosine(1402)-N(4))-methyltransferase RsmH [Bacteroidales bacterium]
MYHSPVLLKASLEGLSIHPDGTYVDATFGGGGHSEAILGALDKGRLIAFDQDPAAAQNVPEDPRILFLGQNFRYMQNFLRLHQAVPVDGILADLGVSSHQFDEAGRGFSTRFQGPLDMRMDTGAGLTAREVVNEYDTDRLADVLYQYGELRNSRKLAGLIASQRKTSVIETTDQLVEVIGKAAPRGKENQFLARVFQAIRIEVNQELEALKELLQQSESVLKSGARLVVISYHSLEDRLVKNYMRAGNFSGEIEKDFYGRPLAPFRTIGKSQTPDPTEIQGNPRARSARLRVAEKT